MSNKFDNGFGGKAVAGVVAVAVGFHVLPAADINCLKISPLYLCKDDPVYLPHIEMAYTSSASAMEISTMIG